MPIDLSILRAPSSHRELSWDSSETALEAGGEQYPVLMHAGVAFADLRLQGVSDAVRDVQRSVYEGQSQYVRDGAGDRAAFMRRFVRRRLGGWVRGKDRLIARAFAELRLAPQARVLEVGCNDGRYLSWVTSRYRCTGVGVDLAETAVRQAIDASAGGFSTSFHLADATALPFADGAFDAVIAFDVFEHVGHQAFGGVMRECRRVLRGGGALLAYIVSEKDRFTLHHTLRAITDGRIGADVGEGHDPANFIGPDRLREVASSSGFRASALEAYHGFWTLYAEEFLDGILPSPAIRVLEWLDAPLTRREYGNGYLARCEAV